MEINQKHKLQQLVPGFDCQKLRVLQEISIGENLTKDEYLMGLFSKLILDNNGAIKQKRYSLLREALLVTPKIAPKLYDALNVVTTVLWIPNLVELYVGNSHSIEERYNAFVLPSNKGDQIYIYIDSSLVEISEFEGICFTLGHEIGHFLLKHQTFPAAANLKQYFRHFKPIDFFELLRFSRRAEVSADRFGYLCVQNFEKAAKDLFRSSCVLTDKWVKFKGTLYMEQLKNIELLSQMDDWDFSGESHPDNLTRTLCLWEFSKSALFYEAINKGTVDAKPTVEMEKNINYLLNKTDDAELVIIINKSPEEREKNFIECQKKFILIFGIYLNTHERGKINRRGRKALHAICQKYDQIDERLVNDAIEHFDTKSRDYIKKAISDIAKKLYFISTEEESASIIVDLDPLIDDKDTRQAAEDREWLLSLLKVSGEVINDVWKEQQN